MKRFLILPNCKGYSTAEQNEEFDNVFGDNHIDASMMTLGNIITAYNIQKE